MICNKNTLDFSIKKSLLLSIYTGEPPKPVRVSHFVEREFLMICNKNTLDFLLKNCLILFKRVEVTIKRKYIDILDNNAKI